MGFPEYTKRKAFSLGTFKFMPSFPIEVILPLMGHKDRMGSHVLRWPQRGGSRVTDDLEDISLRLILLCPLWRTEGADRESLGCPRTLSNEVHRGTRVPSSLLCFPSIYRSHGVSGAAVVAVLKPASTQYSCSVMGWCCLSKQLLTATSSCS